jgi:uncharacterized membrane protein YdjX (TVP38/TMEM64 family)
METNDPALPSALDYQAVPKRRRRWIRIALIAVLFVLLCGAIYFLFFTAAGQELRGNRKQLEADVRALVHRHRLIAPAMYLSVYLLFAVLALPVWWLQLVAGMAFGLWLGTFWSIIGATAGAAITVVVSRWIAAEWFHEKVESKMDRLRKLDRTLGHNGLLVVMTVRLIHLLPFGLCNYALGLVNVRLTEVILGTFLGSIPVVSFYVGEGAGMHPWRNWRFMTILVVLNVLMLLPLAARYLRPQWFRKIGVE